MTKLLLDQSIFTRPSFYLVVVLLICLVLYALHVILYFIISTDIPFYKFMLASVAFLIIFASFIVFNAVKLKRDSINADNRAIYKIKRFDKALVLRSFVDEFDGEQVVSLKIVSESDSLIEATLEDKTYLIEKYYVRQ